MKVGMKVKPATGAEISPGKCLPMSEIQVGPMIHNIDTQPRKGGQMVRDYLLSLLVSFLLSFLLDNQVNPNSQAVSDLTALNPDAIKAVAILLAPIVEEVLFRGVLFGTVRKKSRIFAYILSTVAFAFYHLWQYFLTGFSWHLLLYMLQYVPASIALAWSYEKGRSIWSPVFLHMIMNFLTISIDIGLR